MLLKKGRGKNTWMSVLVVSITLAAVSFLIQPQRVAAGKTAQDFVEECRKKVKEVGLEEALTMLKSGQWIFLDTRTYKENRRGHIPGAINIPRGKLEFKAVQKIPDKNAKVLVYCKKGGHSCLATCTLMEMGYTGVVGMNPGFDAWLEAGHPVE